MADKRDYQLKLADSLANIWRELWQRHRDTGCLFAMTFWQTLIREWSGIDRHRLDKFYALVRSFYWMTGQLAGENEDDTQKIALILENGPLLSTRSDIPDSIRIYLLENFWGMIQDVKVRIGLTGTALMELMRPFIKMMAYYAKPSVFKAYSPFLDALLQYRTDENNESVEVDYKSFGREIHAAGEDPQVKPQNRAILYKYGQSLQQ